MIDKGMLEDWRKFVEYDKKPSNIRQSILKSWKRSKELDIDPYGGKTNKILSTEEFQTKLKHNEKFISIAKPYIEKIYQTIKGLGYLVFLTDNEANLLYIIGDKKILNIFRERLNFQTGANWSEKAVGTTAVSVALEEGRPVPFMAQEKYCFELKKRACAAVPINKMDGRIRGLLGLAANFPKTDGYIFGMLLASKVAIENQFRMQKNNEKLHIISDYYKAIFNSVSDGIVVVDGKGKIKSINKSAQEILSIDYDEAINKNAREVLEFYPVVLDVLNTGKECKEYIIDSKDQKFHYNIKKSIPILDVNNKINGCINIFKKERKDEKEKLKKSNIIGTEPKYTFNDIIGNSKEIQDVKKLAETSAKSNSNILLIGKSGTGKELFAQAIHNASPKAQGPFIAINCGAIPKDLIESEFFGYEAGAFTGARKEGKPGKFELASGGTIFLDEIGEMPEDLQIRLLRILQEKEVTRIGGSRSIPVDVRVIAATNKDLIWEVNEGKFREDLYWRLNVINIRIPDLAQRKEDIPLLIKHFIRKHSKDCNRKYVLDKKTLNVLFNYHWPGNVRELENIVERFLIFAEKGIILPEHLPDYITSRSKGICFNKYSSLEKTEKQLIKHVLSEKDGNITRAARQLGISRNTLYNKLKKYHINR